MRLFVAVPLPSEIQDRAAACLPPDLPGVKPVAPALMHITLAFLGWTPDDQLLATVDAAQAGARGQPPFDLSFDHAGRFPASGRPRALWLGVGAGADELARLAASLTSALRARGLRSDDRPFSPHLTLARVRQQASPAEARAAAAVIEALRVPVGSELRTRVDRIAVIESVLSPGGPRYTTRAEALLESLRPLPLSAAALPDAEP